MDRSSDNLRVLAVVPFAWPTQRSGSEVAIHRLLAWLAKAGHEVRCNVQRQDAAPLDGVDYKTGDASEAYEWADVVIAHQTGTRAVARLREEHGAKPTIQWAHNVGWFYDNAELLDPKVDIVAWNSHALAEQTAGEWTGRSIVLHPPMFSEDFAPCYGTAITQVNLSRQKGGGTFWTLSKMFSELEFIGVVGGWGPQVNYKGRDYPLHQAVSALRSTAPANVSVVHPTTDMLNDVYARTRVLIVPTGIISDRRVGEAWGLVAAEAMACGIPVVASWSAGMEELLGGAGILVEHDDLTGWVEAIELLADEDVWKAYSELSFARATELNPVPELEALEELLLEVVDA